VSEETGDVAGRLNEEQAANFVKHLTDPPILMGILITKIGGTCPFQAEGYFEDFLGEGKNAPFLFRSRIDHWVLGVSKDAGGDPVDGPAWIITGDYRDAGHMKREVAQDIIRSCFSLVKLAKYREENRQIDCCDPPKGIILEE